MCSNFWFLNFPHLQHQITMILIILSQICMQKSSGSIVKKNLASIFLDFCKFDDIRILIIATRIQDSFDWKFFFIMIRRVIYIQIIKEDKFLISFFPNISIVKFWMANESYLVKRYIFFSELIFKFQLFIDFNIPHQILIKVNEKKLRQLYKSINNLLILRTLLA